MKKTIALFIFLVVVLTFFRSNFFHGYLPIPSDTLVGLYHPFRDELAQQFPRGIPFKNFLITDPIRQQYPLRALAISLEKQLQLPLWNPYSFSGYPLLAGMQSAPLYPLNILLFVLPFTIGWSMLIMLQPLLAGVFMFFYLKEQKLTLLASFFGAFVLAFSGFFVAWLEWGTLLHIALWLPLVLLAIDKLFTGRKRLLWVAVIVMALVFSFFAGHLQTFFYVGILSLFYYLFHLFTTHSKKQYTLIGLVVVVCFILIASVQLFPTLQFIALSARNIDQADWHIAGWFIPWQHLLQFVFPDFFGNPTTLNYWGIWNYAELVGYVGILPLLLAISAACFIRMKKIYFFVAVVLISLIFALQNPIAALPFQFSVPFLSNAQPTRLLFLIDFSLAVLAAFGFDYMRQGKKRMLFVVGGFFVVFIVVWEVVKMHATVLPNVSLANIAVASHNMIFPTVVFASIAFILILFILFKKYLPKRIFILIFGVLILITVVDQLRFAEKFTPFTSPSYLYPPTKSLDYLLQNIGNYRLMTTNSEILPPNVSDMYRLQSIEGYDPLYIQRYGEFIAALERNTPNITGPFGFNRIITPHDTASPLLNFLGVKYVLTFGNLTQKNFKQVFVEGQTKVYENTDVLSRAFFVPHVLRATSKQDAIEKVFANANALSTNAIVEGVQQVSPVSSGSAEITSYNANNIVIQTDNKTDGFLVLTDVYYPTWHAYIDGKETRIYITDFTFRGIFVPQGKHTIVFQDQLF